MITRNAKEVSDYLVGIDLGTNSVGMAVTDESYHLLRYKGKDMWFVRKFPEVNENCTNKTKRAFRTLRRNIARKQWRISTLQDLLANQMNAVDSSFFQRVQESSLFLEDKSTDAKHVYFNDADYTDKEFYKEFPTVYHLREAFLMDTLTDRQKEKDRILPYLYIILSQFMKHRGHFLYQGSIEEIGTFDSIWADIKDFLCNGELSVVKEEWNENWKESFETVLSDTSLGVTGAVNLLCEKLTMSFFPVKENKAFLELICNKKVNLSKVFHDIEKRFSESDLKNKKADLTVKLSELDEDAFIKLEGLLNEDEMEWLAKIQGVYSWKIVNRIVKDFGYVSKAKVFLYKEHALHLALLRKALGGRKQKVRFYGEKQKNIFFLKESQKEELLSCFPKDTPVAEYVDVAEFGLNKAEYLMPVYEYVQQAFSEERFLPAQRGTTDAGIPMQLNKKELVDILSYAQKYLPFLNERDDSGYSISEKIVKTFTFRIPYYIGILKEEGTAERAWMHRKKGMEGVKITPWNFEQVVDFSSSATRFIERMTNQCTYLRGEDVLPMNSLLLTQFNAYNCANDILVNGQKLPIDFKQKLCEKVISGSSFASVDNLEAYINANGLEGTVTSAMPFIKVKNKGCRLMKKIFGDSLDKPEVFRMAERMIYLNTVMGGEKEKLKEMIANEFPCLTEKQVAMATNASFSGWGRLSKKIITGINGTEIGYISVLDALKETDMDFMQLYASTDYCFAKRVAIENEPYQFDVNISFASKEDRKNAYHQMLDKMPLPARSKRAIWQAVLMLKDVERAMGCPPKRVFIETTRHEGEKKETISRYYQLKELYGQIEKDIKEYDIQTQKDFPTLKKELDVYQNKLKIRNVFLYFTQFGRCMYTGEKISIDALLKNETSSFDHDHIYPQSLTKDDSVLNNLVLVKKKTNQDKSNYLLDRSIQIKQASFWKMLLSSKLITQEKFNRLMRTKPFSDDELFGFVNRQLVETSQSVKGLSVLLQRLYNDKNGNRIVFVKGEMLADFKNHKNKKGELDYITSYVKVREVNDLHHAKDAYLTIVYGNVIYCKYLATRFWYKQQAQTKEEYKEKYRKFSINHTFDSDIPSAYYMAGREGTLKVVNDTLTLNSPIVTNKTYFGHGALFNEQAISYKGKGAKPSIPRCKRQSDVKKYGGYSGVNPYCLMVVETMSKKGKQIRFESIPLYLKDKIKTKREKEDYCKEVLGLTNPKILLDEIPLGTILEINNFPYRITGSAGNDISTCREKQLVLSMEAMRIIKKLMKLTEKQVEISSFPEGLDKKQLLSVYEELEDKLFNKDGTEKEICGYYGSKVRKIKNLNKDDLVLMKKNLYDFFKGGGFWHYPQTMIPKNFVQKRSLVFSSPTGLFTNRITFG